MRQDRADLGADRLDRDAVEHGEVAGSLADRAVDLEPPFVRLAEVAQPAHRVFGDPVVHVADRHDPTVAPVREAVERVDDPVSLEPPRDRADRHVASREVGA